MGQLTSVVYKEKLIPSVSALVKAMFMAELKNGMLIAGHDLDRIQLPLLLNVATVEEHYTMLCGQSQMLKTGGMFISDQEGILSSILYGPDQRTRITPPPILKMCFTQFTPRMESDWKLLKII